MNFHHVRAFCRIVAEGSFSRAADTLHITQPTISAQVQALEQHLGTRLFERSAKGIALTQAGRVFHDYAEQMLELAERAEEAIQQLRGLARGRLELGASTVPGHYILPAALAAFKAQHPAIEITLCVANSHDVRQAVRDARLEIGLVGEHVRDERLAFEPLIRDELVFVVRAEHPLAEARPDLETLLRQPFVTREYGSGTRSTFEKALQKHGIAAEKLPVVLELGSTEAVKAAIRTIDAVAVLSRWSVADERRLGLLHEIPCPEFEITRSFYLVWRANGYLSVAAETFLAYLRNDHLPKTLPE
jgi:DNA-binding transcriptional LysR family regulator